MTQQQAIALYLNFDMVGSPNYVRFVYDGDNSAFPVGPGAAGGPAAEAAIFGGTAGVAYDSCYHQACDTLANVNGVGFHEMSDAVAHAVLTFAMDTRSVNGEGKGHPVSPPGQAVIGIPTTAAVS